MQQFLDSTAYLVTFSICSPVTVKQPVLTLPSVNIWVKDRIINCVLESWQDPSSGWFSVKTLLVSHTCFLFFFYTSYTFSLFFVFFLLLGFFCQASWLNAFFCQLLLLLFIILFQMILLSPSFHSSFSFVSVIWLFPNSLCQTVIQ